MVIVDVTNGEIGIFRVLLRFKTNKTMLERFRAQSGYRDIHQRDMSLLKYVSVMHDTKRY